MATKAIARRRTIVRYVRRGHRSAAKMTVPLAVIGGFVPLGVRSYNGFKANGWVGGLDGISSGLTGYSVFDQKWHPEIMMQYTAPIIGGFLVHWLAGRLGVNRALGRAKVPFIRI